MSTALAKASRLKPEIRLAQAVSQFEADLSSERKAAFQSYRSQVQNSPPNHSDVMRLAAEIDGRASVKIGGGGRCFGPRLINVLQAVQQFAALGDFIVGSSQNIIACGVWALVRTTLLLVANTTSYLEKLSVLFMTVGRSAPRYQRMALLYPQSKNLQSSLSEYFIVVVRLCHQLLKFTKMSVVGQLVSSLNDSGISTYQSELEFWANSVKEEVSLLLGHKIQDEAEKSSRFRALSNKFSASASHYNKLRMKLHLLESCSKYDHVTTWKQTRKVGNVTQFKQATIYQEWINRPGSCTLVYTGKLGSGKSVLLANVVDHLNSHVLKTNIPVAYFFCRHDIHESLRAKTILGSLARQLLNLIPDLSAENFDETSPVLDLDGLFTLLKRALPSNYRAYFILDGLDDCEASERQLLVEWLRKLQDTFALLICVSIGLGVEKTVGLGSEQFTAPSVISIPDHNPDIESFIGVELESCLQAGKLVIGDPALILEIQKALLEGAEGMFLWVALQIESLCAEKTDEAIRQSLLDLPKDLSETFFRVLRRSKASGGPYQKLILELITAALRPLTMEELREALSVVPGDITWNPARLLNDLYSTLASCGSLIAIDEEELTIRVVHHSVKQFLLNTSEDSSEIPFTIDSAHRKMANTIITYLNYGIFSTQLSTRTSSQIMTGSIPSRIIHSTLESTSNVRGLALKLLQSRKQPSFDIGKVLARETKHFEPQFYTYAKTFWLQHIAYIPEAELLEHKLLAKLFQENSINIDLKNPHDSALLSWAIQFGHKAIVELLLNAGKIDVDSEDLYGQTPFLLAVICGQENIIKLLLETGKIDVNSSIGTERKTQAPRPPLLTATQLQHEKTVKLLLDIENIDINLKDDGGHTPLQAAADRGNEEIFKLLLNTGKADVNTEDLQGWTPLAVAALFGHECIVKLLLGTGKVHVDPKDRRGQTPLLIAVDEGHEGIVQLLLGTAEVDINSADNRGRTPLSLAEEKGNEAIVKLLESSKHCHIMLTEWLRQGFQLQGGKL